MKLETGGIQMGKGYELVLPHNSNIGIFWKGKSTKFGVEGGK